MEPKYKGITFDTIRLGKYARRPESWAQTCKRVVDYNLSLYKGPASEDELRKEAELMFDLMFNCIAFPAGRTMKIGGTQAAIDFAEANFNCAFTIINSIEDICDVFHLSMCSCGVGFRILKEDVAQLPSFNTDISVSHSGKWVEIEEGKIVFQYNDYFSYGLKKEDTTCQYMGWQGDTQVFSIVIGDSKLGWVDALRHYLNIASCHTGKVRIELDYSYVRPEGTPLKTWGGYAAGPEGLAKMFDFITKILKSSNGKLRPIHVLDICNFIGAIVVVGGSRRAAEIALFSPDDEEVLNAKSGDNLGWWIDLEGNKTAYDDELLKAKLIKWKPNAENDHRTMSNNSITFTSKPSYEQLQSIFERIRQNGEPGFFNLEAARKRRPNCEGLNPCAEILLDSKGVCNLTTINLMAMIREDGLVDWNLLRESVRLITRVGLRMTNVTLSLTKWDAVQKRDRLLGVSKTGEMDFLDAMGWKRNDINHLDLLAFMSEVANLEATRYAEEMGVPRPLLVTAVKPEGCWTKDHIRTLDQGLLFIDEINPNIDNSLGFSDISGLSSNGYRVKKSFNKGKSRVLEVVLNNKRRLRITPNHPLSIQGDWVKASDLKIGMVIDFKLGNYKSVEDASLKSSISISDLKSDTRDYQLPDRVSPDLAWLLGLYMGDGSFTTNDRIKLIGSDYSIHLKAQRIWKSLFGVETSIIKCSDRNAFTQDFRSSKIRRWFGENGLDKQSYEYLERIPEKIRRSSKESIIAFIAGWSDADGCYYQNAMCIDNKSESIIRHLQEIGEAVGLSYSFCTNKERKSSHSKNNIYKSHLNRFFSIQESLDLLNRHSVKAGSKPVKKSANLTHANPYQIKEIHELDEDLDAYDIEIDSIHWYYQGALKSHNTISLLPTVSSGVHRAFAPHYIRNIKFANFDPMCKALIDLGVPHETDKTKKDSNRIVFRFPIKTKATSHAYDEPFRDQFMGYINHQDFYTDHNTSCTLYVGEDEWQEALDLVFKFWDKIIAVSFLPKDKGRYPQAPNEECTEEEYLELKSQFPEGLEGLDELLQAYEGNVHNAIQMDEGADCSSGACPSV